MEIVNWSLLKHPFNWLIVVLMVLIAGAALHFAMMMHFKPTASA
jgi:hypothetical protein